jgi:hypothetical protein
MGILDRIAAFIDRREINDLRVEIVKCKSIINNQERIIAEQVCQIASANHRVSYTTNANLELKRVCRANGINVDDMVA